MKIRHYTEHLWKRCVAQRQKPMPTRIRLSSIEDRASYPALKSIVITTNTEYSGYWLAHELGHCACHHAAKLNSPTWIRFIYELQAWDWALTCNPNIPIEAIACLTGGKADLLLTYVVDMRISYKQTGYNLAKQAVTALLEKYNLKWNKAWDVI